MASPVGTGDVRMESRTKKVKTVFSGFWDEGVLGEDGRTDYTGLNLSMGEDVYEVRVGDAVMLRGDDAPHTDPAASKNSSEGSSKVQERKSEYTADAENEQKQNYYGQINSSQPPMMEAKVGDGVMLARVERIWQEKSRSGRAGKILFEARWFLKVRSRK